MSRSTNNGTLRIGVAFAGDPAAAGTWSGTPASLGGALRDAGAVVEPLRAQAPRPIERVVADVSAITRLHRTRLDPGSTLRDRARVARTIGLFTSRESARLRSWGLRRQFGDATEFDAVVQIGTGYIVPATTRLVTFEDMTVAQAVALPYPEWRCLSPREQQARIALGRRVYEQAAACCFTTRWAADSAMTDYGVPQEKIHVVGVGRNHAPRPVERDWTTPRFLFVGGDWARKNGDAVVRAFTQVRQEIPKAQLDLAGNHPRVDVDGVVGHGWLSLAVEADRQRLDRLFEAATCFVMPSHCEPCGIAYVEAAAAGVPSIGSTVGGSGELIGDGGCVVSPDDPHAILAAMRRLADPEVGRTAGARAREGSELFTWPQVARRMLAAIDPSPQGRDEQEDAPSLSLAER